MSASFGPFFLLLFSLFTGVAPGEWLAILHVLEHVRPGDILTVYSSCPGPSNGFGVVENCIQFTGGASRLEERRSDYPIGCPLRAWGSFSWSSSFPRLILRTWGGSLILEGKRGLRRRNFERPLTLLKEIKRVHGRARWLHSPGN